MQASNALLKLGGGLDRAQKGKASVPGNRATKNAQKDEYYPHRDDAIMPETSNKREFPLHSKAEIVK